MYTTLETLKNGNACTPGYGRMLSFFTTRIQFKKMPIPLWMVGLVGHYDDMEWATENAMIFDEKMFANFRERTLLSAIKCLFWNSYRDDWDGTHQRNKLAREAHDECIRLKTSQEANEWLAKWSKYHFSHSLWHNVVENDIFHLPHKYIRYVQDHQKATASYKHRREIPQVKSEDRYFPWSEGKSKAENFAMLCIDGDPYAFMVQVMKETKLSVNRGVTISEIEEGGTTKYVATIHVTDPKRIFQMAHMVQADTLDVTEVTGVNALLEAASGHIASVNDSGHSRSTVEAMQQLMNNTRAPSLNMPGAATIVPTGPSRSSTDPDSADDDDDLPRNRRTGAVTRRRRAAARAVPVTSDGDEEEEPERHRDRDDDEDEDS